MRRLLILLAVLVPLAAPVSASAKLRTIRTGKFQVTHLGSYAVSLHPDFNEARRALGVPDATDRKCNTAYHSLGLKLQFENLSGKPGCVNSSVQYFSIRGAAGRATWQTSRGLRLGDPLSRVRRLYPHALKTPNTRVVGYTRNSPFGTGPLYYLWARIHNGRVSSLVGYVGGAGE